VTCPLESTIVRPVGSGKDPCRNHAGDPSTAGPSAFGGWDSETAGIPLSIMPVTRKTTEELRPSIGTSVNTIHDSVRSLAARP
jgi:hypothetical protein